MVSTFAVTTTCVLAMRMVSPHLTFSCFFNFRRNLVIPFLDKGNISIEIFFLK